MRNRARRASAFRIGAAAAAALAVLVVIALPQRLAPGSTASAQPSASVAVVPTPTTGSGIGMCVEQYSAQTLAHRTIAFDGTVIATHGEDATFRVNTAFRGVTAPGPVTLTATGMTGDAITSVGGPALKVGDRYLVAGEDHFAWACGFTQPWSEQATSAWARVLAP